MKHFSVAKTDNHLNKLVPCDEPVVVEVNSPEGQLHSVLVWVHNRLLTAAQQPTAALPVLKTNKLSYTNHVSWITEESLTQCDPYPPLMAVMVRVLGGRVLGSVRLLPARHVHQLSLGPQGQEVLPVHVPRLVRQVPSSFRIKVNLEGKERS